MLMSVAPPTRPRLQRRHASERVLTLQGDACKDISLVEITGLRDAATTVSADTSLTLRNSPNVNITVDEVQGDDDDEPSPEAYLQSTDIISTSSVIRNSPDVNITVDEVADDDDDDQDGEKSLTTPYTSGNTISNDGTSNAGSVKYVEYVEHAQSDATPSMDFVRQLDTATQHNVYTFTAPQSRRSHRTTVQQKTWYHLETIEEVLSPIADTVQLPPTFAHALSLTTLPEAQKTDVLHKHFPLLVVELIKDGDDMSFAT